ncbi:hypothetical protein [Wenyingzhuangia marina]|uniref:Uncharacterized protein n=1 Tax=Wenyingzhuangia marina TaxID=1195760 RepID=A0A1M5SWY1_9FLAO|nr:hypothetical protein [Wenyingzhuangia marina]GGF64536.1 hypothetical protein GCM10011397_04350 [Wenyingzhuangia marina]SHH43081.1 hypothetical protein SAMN05444281_0577 [Wenyingzhuangia marina]
MKEIESDKIFDLLAIKSYEELDNAERELVDKELSPTEYESFRDVIRDFKEVDESIELIKPETTFKKAQEKKKWWNYSIPTYQVAAVLVVAMMSTFILTKNSMKQSTDIVQVNSQLDTLRTSKKSINMEEEKYPTAFVIYW